MAEPAKMELKGADITAARFQQLQESLGKQLMGDIGMFLMTRVKTRTAAGIDVDGAPFTPYTAKYAFFRQSKGRPIDKVDLFFTGSMMSAMTMEETKDQVRVFFMGTQDRTGMSNPAKAFYLNEKRKFFAISDQDRVDIGSLVLDTLREGGLR